MPILKRASFAVLLLILAWICPAQDGDSTAGLARTRYLSTTGALPAARDVAVEDFVNYHRHEIPRPKAGEAVAVDVRWGEDRVSSSGEAVLQVGLSTALAHTAEELPPLNLSIVIDKSGSMADDNKLNRVKSALTKVVSQLRPCDTLSIVVFDSEARVLLPARKVTDSSEIDSLIQQIQPGSATNLNGGLMLGYQEASRHFQKDGANRVLLLTDGIANRGVIDPDEIAHASAGYNDRGIDLCTIGVGSDVNQDFLRRLAKSGRGLFHFVANSQDIEKVFVDELQSQLAPVASEPDLTIKYGSGLKVQKVYGYNPVLGDGFVRLKLDTMNSGMTRAVLVRFKAASDEQTGTRLPVDVSLSYFDLARKKQVALDQNAAISVADTDRPSEDPSVAKNYCIARLAQAIHDMAGDCERQQFSRAQAVLDREIESARPYRDDPDVQRTLGIATRYRDILREQHGSSEEADVPEIVHRQSGPNLVINGDFSMGNSHFMCGLGEYVPPTDNCLWSHSYTIAPAFDSPSLHHLVMPGDFAAPERRTGNEQVMFMNSGGTDSIDLWSSIVKCQPHTRYRITFYAISLSGTQWQDGHEIPTEDWLPNFEITIGGRKSAAQPAGCGHYSKVAMIWDSGSSTSSSLSIVRTAMVHNGGIIGIANISMIPSGPGL